METLLAPSVIERSTCFPSCAYATVYTDTSSDATALSGNVLTSPSPAFRPRYVVGPIGLGRAVD